MPLALTGLLIAVKATCLRDRRKLGQKTGKAAAEGDEHTSVSFGMRFPQCHSMSELECVLWCGGERSVDFLLALLVGVLLPL